MSGDALIDLYCHIYPDRFFHEMNKAAPKLGNIAARLRGVKKIHDLDARFREMDEFDNYRQVISLPGPSIEEFASGGTGLALARVANDAMAELCAKHPDRFAGFVAALSLTDVMGSIEEAKRAIGQLGAAGVQIFTPLAGRPLDEPAFEPFFAAMAQLDRPIWLHPARTAAMPDYTAEQKSRFEMWWCFGWPYDTSVAMVRLAFCGLFDRYPNLRIITHHLGGMIPYFDGRIGPGLDVLGARTSDEDYSRILPSLKRPHLDYMHDFYADTAMFGGGRHALRCGFDFFGADKVVFATDTPLGPIKPAIDALNALDISAGRSPQDFLGQCREAVGQAAELIYFANDHPRAERVFDADRNRHADGRIDAAVLDSGAAVVGDSRAGLPAGARENSRRTAYRLSRHQGPRRRNGRILRPPRRVTVVRTQRGKRITLPLPRLEIRRHRPVC